jgi:hypothetical protein
MHRVTFLASVLVCAVTTNAQVGRGFLAGTCENNTIEHLVGK